MDVVATVKAAGTVVRFIEGGPLAEGLAELNIAAAATDLDKARTARDKRAQVWSAVNHLESAEAALSSTVVGRPGQVQFALRMVNVNLLKRKLDYTRALMAVCYRYLGEEELARQAIERGRHRHHDDIAVAIKAVGFVTGLVVPVDLFRMDKVNKYTVDWDAFELPPRELPAS